MLSGRSTTVVNVATLRIQMNRATFRTGGNGYANACIGCAHFDALKNQSFLDGTRQLVEWQRYSLAAAMYAYDDFL